jgi:3-dehydroquinate synthase
MAEITVRTAGGEYQVHIGRDILERGLAGYLSRVVPHRVAVVTHPRIYELHGRRLRAALDAADAGRPQVYDFLFEEGEENKNLYTLESGYKRLLESGITREDLLLAFGGGVVGDLAGFLAATYMRGIRYLQVPTTLMAMVDSAIGGKVGVDLPGAKNAVGAFHQPLAVYADLVVLDTLSERELRSGLAEVVKYGFLYDAELLKKVEGWERGLPERSGDLGETIARCASHKAAVVSADERDLSGERAMLNYGHTFGHAIESACGYGELRHGEAVAIGMIMAARLAEMIGLSGEGLYDLHRRVLLPVLRGGPARVHLERARIEADMNADKKKGRQLRFVLLEEPQAPRLLEAVAEKCVADTVEETLEMLRGEEICH